MRIYTRTGDDGTTGLLGGARVPKDALRLEAYGTVDELNAAIGLARAQGADADLDAALVRVQEELFALGAALATPPGARAGVPAARLGAEAVERLEREIDGWEAELEPLRSFILPGGAGAAAALHLARTVCRRAERRVVALARAEGGAEPAAVYLNRLADHLFVAARTANRRGGGREVPWRGSA